MPRCEGCGKMAGYEAAEPDSVDAEINEDGELQVTAEVSLNSSCCDEQIKTGTIEITQDLSERLAGHLGEGHELSVDTDGGTFEEEKKGVYKFTCEVSIACSCKKLFAKDAVLGKEPGIVVTMSDTIKSSEMDEA